MPEMTPDFQAVLTALTSHNVRFVLIGGLAMAAYGSAHVTQDIDAGYARDRENIAAVRAAFAPLHPRLRGFPADLPFVWDERTLRAATNLTLDTDVSPVDLLGDIPGVDSFEGLWNRSVTTQLYGMTVQVASIDDLIAMKRAANRPKDQVHLLELLALQQLIDNELRGSPSLGEHCPE